MNSRLSIRFCRRIICAFSVDNYPYRTIATLWVYFLSFIMGVMFFAPSFAIAVVNPYPQYRLNPVSPTIQDNVSFLLVKGMNGNSCVPRYIASYKIEQVAVECFAPPCPQRNVIKISYSQIIVPPLEIIDIVCAAVMTEYGPSFNFGKLSAGDYTIIDSTDGNRILMTFSVTPTRQLHDSVVYTPKKPTSKDSLFFSLLTINHDACTRIYNEKVQVYDTIIYLSYQYYDNWADGACIPITGKTIGFKSGPIHAGYYAMYEVSDLYCPPGSICPMARIAPQRVGQITVVPATGIVPFANTHDSAARFAWSEHNGTITLRFRRVITSDVFAELYTARGSMVKKIRMQKTGVDQYEAIWEPSGRDNASFVPGTYFARINVDGKTMSIERISVLK